MGILPNRLILRNSWVPKNESNKCSFSEVGNIVTSLFSRLTLPSFRKSSRYIFHILDSVCKIWCWRHWRRSWKKRKRVSKDDLWWLKRKLQKKVHLTNRFHVAVRLFSNRSQMTSKCGKNKKVAHEAIAECVSYIITKQTTTDKAFFISKSFNITRKLSRSLPTLANTKKTI